LIPGPAQSFKRISTGFPGKKKEQAWSIWDT